MDTVAYTELRNALLKEFNMGNHVNLIRKFPFRYIKKAYHVPEQSIPNIIDTLDTLYRFGMNI